MRIHSLYKGALLGIWLCIFALNISFSNASSESISGSIKEEDTLKKIPSIFKKHHHGIFSHPIPAGLKKFFHKHKIPSFKPKPHPIPVYKPKPIPIPVYKPKPHSIPVYKPKPNPIPVYKPKPHSIPVYKPKPHPNPVFKKLPFHFHPFFKKPFFSHPKKPIAP